MQRRTEQWLLLLLVLLLAVAFVARLKMNYAKDPHGSDFNLYRQVSLALYEGKAPYDPATYRFAWGQQVPIVSPPQAMVLMPLALIDFYVSFYVFFFLNVCALLVLFFASMDLFCGKDRWRQNVLFVTALLLLFFNTATVSNLLSLGQLSAVVSMLIMAGVFLSSPIWRGASWALALALKFSFLPFLILVMFRPNKVATLLWTAAILIPICLTPLLFEERLFKLYHDYSEAVKDVMKVFNSYSVDGAADRVDFAFFKSDIVHIAYLGMVAMLLAWITYREWGRKQISLNLMFFICCLGMTVVYHRVQDMPLVLCLMLTYVYLFYEHKQWPKLFIILAFFMIYLIPARLIQFSGNWIGEYIGRDNAFIALGIRDLSFAHIPIVLKTIFPVHGVATLLLAVYAGYLYFRKEPVGQISA